MNYRADKRYRLTHQEDIARLFDRGRRASDRMITLLAAPNDPAIGHSRLGVGVSKKHGNAVKRNRVKRLCRESFRLIRHELPAGWDFMIVPRVREDLTVEAIQESLRRLAARLTEQPPAGGEEPAK